jgi:hypothetical protein
MRMYGKGGWYGNPQGHAMAARGMRLYASKQRLVDPMFYAKREEMVPASHIMDMVAKGCDYQKMRAMHPDADAEDLRLRGIKAVDQQNAHPTLSELNRNGVDMTAKLAKGSPRFKVRVLEVLHDPQASSFLSPVKVKALKEAVQ